MTVASVTVIGGYLGAGKTTLVNHLLRSATEPVAVLVNDFGSVNIDADLIVSHDGTTMELANGCICCSLVDGFVDALASVTEQETPPERIIIEASGVAHPGSVAAYAHRPGLRYDGTVVAADVTSIKKLSTDKYVGDTVSAQLQAADIVLATKADLHSHEKLEADLAWLAGASGAPVIPVRHGQVDPVIIAGLEPDAVPGPSTSTITPVDFAATVTTTAATLDRALLTTALEELSDDVVRVKGVVNLEDDASWAVHRVGRRVDISWLDENPVSRSRLVLMGRADALPDTDWLDSIG